MHLMADLLVAAHEADLERDVRKRRLEHLVDTCRRRVLGILPIGGMRKYDDCCDGGCEAADGACC